MTTADKLVDIIAALKRWVEKSRVPETGSITIRLKRGKVEIVEVRDVTQIGVSR